MTMVQKARDMLTGNILPFWMSLRDNEFGGYYGWMDFDLKLDKKAVKGCILNSRILWFFSNAAMVLDRKDLLDEAEHAYKFLRDYCYDRRNGGVFWSLNYDGTVFDSTKHTYNQAFAIYALSSYYQATGCEEALTMAKELYRIIEERCTDSRGFLEAFDETFHPVSNEKLSENGVMAEKTMNTLLHVFEGYSGLYQVTHDPEVGESLRRILKSYEVDIYNPEKHRQEVFFDKDFNSLLDMHSYGHDIESSWLVDWGCSLLGDEELNRKIFAINSDLANEIYHTAYHKHSLWNECVNGVDDKNRVWWVQAETVLGFLNAWQKEPERTEYKQAAEDVLDYIREKVVDPRPGSEWFWLLDDNGEPVKEKPIVEPWKCPYHNGRMCFEIIRRNAE